MATVYIRRNCAKCDDLVTKSRGRYGAVTIVDVSTNPERIPELLKLTGGRRIVPVIVDGTTLSIAPDGGSEF